MEGTNPYVNQKEMGSDSDKYDLMRENSRARLTKEVSMALVAHILLQHIGYVVPKLTCRL